MPLLPPPLSSILKAPELSFHCFFFFIRKKSLKALLLMPSVVLARFTLLSVLFYGMPPPYWQEPICYIALSLASTLEWAIEIIDWLIVSICVHIPMSTCIP